MSSGIGGNLSRPRTSTGSDRKEIQMRAGRRFTFSPATALALVALFFALGGSAFAVGERVQASSAASRR
jgi:hypothetical protein